MAFAQLTYRESLRDIEVCLLAQRNKPDHGGLSGPVHRSTLADAPEKYRPLRAAFSPLAIAKLDEIAEAWLATAALPFRGIRKGRARDFKGSIFSRLAVPPV